HPRRACAGVRASVRAHFASAVRRENPHPCAACPLHSASAMTASSAPTSTSLKPHRSRYLATPPAREKIAILGRGMPSLTPPFASPDTQELRDRYEIPVYQDGWLLGGKGASVRNRDENGRIEEHGLHVWLGYYENAFTLMRRCYDELGRPPDAPLATLREAF